MKRKICDFSGLRFKDAGDGDPGGFEGYASVWGNVDRDGDVACKGMFSGCIDRLRAEGIVTVNHDLNGLPVATIERLEEDEKGLFCSANFHTTADAQAARTVVKERMERGKSVGLSFTYVTTHADRGTKDGKNVRFLREVDTYEIGIAFIPCNPDAGATDAKGVSGSASLPLAPKDHEWDSGEAVKRVREWADATEKPNAKYRRAFLWYDDSAPEKFGSYKLPFADVIDGELHAVPKALSAVLSRLGKTDIPDDDKDAVRRKVQRYQRQAGRESDKKDMAEGDDTGGGYTAREDSKGALMGFYKRAARLMRDGDVTSAAQMKRLAQGRAAAAQAGMGSKGQYLGDSVGASMAMAAVRCLNDTLFYSVLPSMVYDWDNDDDSVDETMEAVEGALSEFCALACAAIRALLAGVDDGDLESGDAAAAMKSLWPPSEGNSFGAGGEPAQDSQGTAQAAGTLEQQLTNVLAAAASCIERAEKVADLRESEGRRPLAARRGQLVDLNQKLATLLERVAPDEGAGAGEQPVAALSIPAMQAAALKRQAALRRVPVVASAG